MKIKTVLCLLIISLTSACGADSSNNSKAASKPATTKTPTLIDPQLEVLEKAKTVEESLQKDVDKRHQEMLKQGI